MNMKKRKNYLTQTLPIYMLVMEGGGGASPRSCFLRLERVGAGKICYFYIEVGIFSL